MNSTITTNPNRYSERVTSYTLNGAIRRLQRHGLKDNGVYGKIDNLNITLEGNRVVAVTDDAAPLLRAGSTDFADGSDTTAEYTYNGVGALPTVGISWLPFVLSFSRITRCASLSPDKKSPRVILPRRNIYY